MDEHYWMTSYECILVVGCNLSSVDGERVLDMFGILFGFLGS